MKVQPLNFKVELDPDIKQDSCDGCRTYEADAEIELEDSHLLLCRTCLHRIRPALKQALKLVEANYALLKKNTDTSLPTPEPKSDPGIHVP